MQIGEIYQIEYLDHFEDNDAKELTITEVGFYLGETEEYYYFSSYKDSEGGVYNRTGIMKRCIQTLNKLVIK